MKQQVGSINKNYLTEIYDHVSKVPGKLTEYDDVFARQTVTTKKFIGEELGIILYKLLSEKFTPEYLRHEMNRYIGESRNREEPTKELFKEYFYQVILYKERKPGIYLEIDDHMRRIFVLEFFKRIIQEYLDKQEGKSSAKNSRVFT